MMACHPNPEDLDPKVLQVLAEKQHSIDALDSYEDQCLAADKAWNSKPKAPFKKIDQWLRETTHAHVWCCYCEHDRGVEVEHVFCKKLFPSKTFSPDNFLLVCGHCNRKKLDAFRVFLGTNGTEYQDYPKRCPATLPASEFSVFIDPRKLDPMHFFEIRLGTGEYVVRQGLEGREHEMAGYTKDILELNGDHCPPKQRQRAVSRYRKILEDYIGCRESSDYPTLLNHLPESILPDHQEFAEHRAEAMQYWMDALASSEFPSVWREIKRQYLFNPTAFLRLYPTLKLTLDSVPELVH